MEAIKTNSEFFKLKNSLKENKLDLIFEPPESPLYSKRSKGL